MQQVTIVINLFSYWHVGTGAGRGGEADAITIKDAFDLPYLPGREVKGLLREAVQTAEDFDREDLGTTLKLFGPKGQLTHFQDAVLPPDIYRILAAGGKGYTRQLYRLVASTAIDKKGLADEDCLRTIEVCVPVKLITVVTGIANNGEWPQILKRHAGTIRTLGLRRRRGFGRCCLTVVT